LIRVTYSLKEKIGAVIYDLPRFVWSMRPSSHQAWVSIRNRDERLRHEADGAQCDWLWTSDLHLAKVFPQLGRRLMRRALRDWPIEFRSTPIRSDEKPEVSFIIGHRGLDRLPHLLLTIQSIASQRNASVECIVVEQAKAPDVKSHLASWVRYVHTPLFDSNTPYCRSWAFNVGARVANGKVLVLHDNDMLVPTDYAAEILARQKRGSEVVNLKRFIFYLSKEHSNRILSKESSISDQPPDSIVQNLEAGGSVAISREAYLGIGGFDESFIGWGGEDNEFWERAQTRRVWPYGSLPIVHLWHTAQPGKHEQQRETAELLEVRSAISPEQRIAELAVRDFGNPQSLLVAGHRSSVAGQHSCAE
jgi:hypothetical protein